MGFVEPVSAAEIDLETVVVTGTDQSRYRVDDKASLTGFPLDYLELPRVVDVIPEQILLDQKVTELEEALRNVPGISYSDGFGGSNNDFLIRGFRRNTVYRDGLRVASNFRVNTTNLDSVRVIKGPASITYGQVEPGGLVDIVTKKPLEERRIYGEARGGSFNDYLFLVDWSQPIGDRAAIRINVSTQDSDSFRDFFDISRDAIALSGIYHLSDNTRIDVSYEFRDEFRSFDRGTITVPTPEGREIVNRVLDIPIQRRFGEAYEEIDTEVHFATLGISHDFSDAWNASFKGAWEKSHSDDFQARPRSVRIYDQDAPIENGIITGPAVPEAVFDEPSDQVYLVRRSDGSRDRNIEAFYLQGKVTGDFQTGAIRHRIAVGGDFRHTDESRYFVALPDTNGIPVSEGGRGPLFNVEDPVYGILPDELPTAGLPLITAEATDYGFFVNDYVNLTDRLGLLLGGRMDFSDPDGGGPAGTVDAFSPQAAVNYRLLDTLSVFMSYSEAFEPNTTFSVDPDGSASETRLFDPEDSRQYELGLKAQFFDRRLSADATVYKIKKSNVVTVVDGIPQLVEGQQSQGLEVSLRGQPMPGMNIVAGYAYTDAEILTGADAGNRPTNVAKHTFNFWGSYEVQAGPLQGLGAGAGVFHLSDRYGDNANSWKLGSYTLVDLSLWYTLPARAFGSPGGVRLQFSVKNLFDKEYYPASGGDLRVSIGSPRTFLGSISATF
jgi:iron complex outermembrane receptor protein